MHVSYKSISLRMEISKQWCPIKVFLCVWKYSNNGVLTSVSLRMEISKQWCPINVFLCLWKYPKMVSSLMKLFSSNKQHLNQADEYQLKADQGASICSCTSTVIRFQCLWSAISMNTPITFKHVLYVHLRLTFSCEIAYRVRRVRLDPICMQSSPIKSGNIYIVLS